LKTIRQIAEEIGVSKQAVFYRISKPPLSKAIKKFISKTKGVLTVSLDGEKLIKSAFLNDCRKNDTVKEMPKENTSFDSIINILKNELEIKNLLISEQQQTIKELVAIIKKPSANTNDKSRSFISGRAIPKTLSIPIKRLMKYQAKKLKDFRQSQRDNRIIKKSLP